MLHDAVRRRHRGAASLGRRRGCAGGGDRDRGAAARQKAAEDRTPVGGREGADRDGAPRVPVPLPALAVLHPRRGRRPSRRGERRAVHQASAATPERHAVHPDHPQPQEHGGGRPPVRSHHGRTGCVQDPAAEVRVSAVEQYFVVAADGKEYGPADLETLRQWVREGRVVKATHIKKGSGGTTFAGKLPELLDLFPPKEPAATAVGQAPPPQPLPSTVTLPSEFRVWEFIGLAWDIVKPHWLILAGMFFIKVAIGAVPYLGGCVHFIIGGAI